jgi:hypothetical protein
MKFVPIGLQCSVPEGIKRANLREYSYPFDWLWTPSKTTYEILKLLIDVDGVDRATEYMTEGYTYYRYLGNKHYSSVPEITESQMNPVTGLGNTHFTINSEYKKKLRIRFERLLRDIRSAEGMVLVYADAANAYLNYHLDEVEYGVDATEYLEKIHALLSPIKPGIQIVYFCWTDRLRDDTTSITYVPYTAKNGWGQVSEHIQQYLVANYPTVI